MGFKKINLIFQDLINISFFLYLIFNFNKFINDNSFLYIYKNEWSFSETFINYSSGFVRRGLIGEIFELIKLPINYYHISSFIFYTISLFHIFFFLIKKLKKFSFSNQIVFLFSSFGFLYFANNLNFFFGRRDLLILNLLIFISNYEKKTNNNKKLIITIIFSLFVSLNYEVILLFLPLIWFLVIKENNDKKIVVNIYFLVLTFLNICLLIFYSRVEDFDKLCKNISFKREMLNLNNAGCWGAPAYLSNTNFSTATNEVILGLEKTGLNIWLILFLNLLLVMVYFLGLDLKQLLLIAPLFFLFFIAVDYGRWFFLIFSTSLIISENYKNPSLKLNLFFGAIVLASYKFIEMPIYLFQEINYFDF